MESQSFDEKKIIRETLKLLLESCEFLIEWNKSINTWQDYPISSSGMQTMAASCMLLETIGEEVKSIDKRDSIFLETNAPNIPWRDYVGIRNKIAHGYHNLDAEVIFETVKKDIPELKKSLEKLLKIIE